MKPPVISILLPSLNTRRFLEERIESILAQTFSDWEAIVLDSYSTDGSWELFQSVAARDARFRLYQIPGEGLYAALNRGIALANGEFVYIATCDDTMVPECLATMIEAFAMCPDAGIAASDVMLINDAGDALTPEDIAGRLPTESIRDLFALEKVRAYPTQTNINYRKSPHDCLLHFTAKSVYLSLTQLLIRTNVARTAPPFDAKVGSHADVGWAARLTNLTGTVHIPAQLATWRFHGDQLSVQHDDAKLYSLRDMLECAASEVHQRYSWLLTSNDRAALLLPCLRYLARSRGQIIRCWIQTAFHSLWMLAERPFATVLAVWATGFRPGNVRRTFVPMFMQRIGLSPQEIDQPVGTTGAISFADGNTEPLPRR